MATTYLRPYKASPYMTAHEGELALYRAAQATFHININNRFFLITLLSETFSMKKHCSTIDNSKP